MWVLETYESPRPGLSDVVGRLSCQSVSGCLEADYDQLQKVCNGAHQVTVSRIVFHVVLLHSNSLIWRRPTFLYFFAMKRSHEHFPQGLCVTSRLNRIPKHRLPRNRGALPGDAQTLQRKRSLSLWPWVKIQIVPPVTIPIQPQK